MVPSHFLHASCPTLNRFGIKVPPLCKHLLQQRLTPTSHVCAALPADGRLERRHVRDGGRIVYFAIPAKKKSLKTLPCAHEAIFLVPILMPWQPAHFAKLALVLACCTAAFLRYDEWLRETGSRCCKASRSLCPRIGQAPRRSSSTGLLTTTAIPSSQVCTH